MPAEGVKNAMKPAIRWSLKSFLLEACVYAALIALYFVAVLHFLGPSLQRLYNQDRRLYAALALALIVGQGLLLEVLTRLLLTWITPPTED
jgi:hypothetical protein